MLTILKNDFSIYDRNINAYTDMDKEIYTRVVVYFHSDFISACQRRRILIEAQSKITPGSGSKILDTPMMIACNPRSLNR
jgi:hypothetical protein